MPKLPSAIESMSSASPAHEPRSTPRPPEENAFQRLIQDVRQYLGPSSGIDSADVDPRELLALMAKYESNKDEWRQYTQADPSRNYTRTLVDTGNGRYNLVMIVWNQGKGSPIHDHANAHCIMRVLEGRLNETVYGMPEPEAAHNSPLSVKKNTTYQEKEVAYISDKIGLHRVSNPDSENVAISLHLYTPPNAAIYGYNIYNEKTGNASHVP